MVPLNQNSPIRCLIFFFFFSFSFFRTWVKIYNLPFWHLGHPLDSWGRAVSFPHPRRRKRMWHSPNGKRKYGGFFKGKRIWLLLIFQTLTSRFTSGFHCPLNFDAQGQNLEARAVSQLGPSLQTNLSGKHVFSIFIFVKENLMKKQLLPALLC